METTAPTPNWLVGLLVIFSLAAAAVFGLYLFRHTQRASLDEQHEILKAQLEPLRLTAARYENQYAPLEKQILARRSLLAPIETYDGTNRADADRALTTNSATLKTNEGLQDKAIATFSDAMKEAPERRQELGREEERAFTTERDNDDRRRQLREDVEKQSQAIESQKKKWRGEKAGLDDRVGELEGRVRQLTNQLDSSNREFKVDGTILASEAADGFVVIGLGFAEHLRSGTKFTVFNRRGGKIVVKGQILVTEVREHVSTASSAKTMAMIRWLPAINCTIPSTTPNTPAALRFAVISSVSRAQRSRDSSKNRAERSTTTLPLTSISWSPAPMPRLISIKRPSSA